MKLKGELIVGILSFSATVAIASAASLGSVADLTIDDVFRGDLSGLKGSTANQVDTSKSASTCDAQLTAQNPDSQINLRAAATTASAIRGYGLVGDRVSILDQTRGYDGYTWYNVRFPSSRAEGWIRGDLVNILDREERCNAQAEPPSLLENIRPSLPEEDSRLENNISMAQDQRNSNSVVTPVVSSDNNLFDSYTQEEIDFFLNIAMGTEFGGHSRVVRKWNRDIKVRIIGSPTVEDRETLHTVINELNDLMDQADPNSIDIELLSASSNETANFEVYIVPLSQFQRYAPNVTPGELGVAWPVWRGNDIYSARIFVTSNIISQRERSHLIREEFTQSLGLLRDTEDDRYRSSIFYQWWTDTNQFTSLDRSVISMLYRPDIRPGMSPSEVTGVLQRGRVTTSASQQDQTSLFGRALNVLGLD